MNVTLLRSPPFPSVRANVAAVANLAASDDGGGDVASSAELEAALRAMADAGVGGDFWGDRPVLPDSVTRWAHPENPEEVAALVAGLMGKEASVAVSLPGHRWARRAAVQLRVLGCHVLSGPHDPWHILKNVDEVLIGPVPRESAVLGLAAGRRLVAFDGGRPDHAAIRKAASRMLLHAVQYRDPFANGTTISLYRAIELLAFWRGEMSRNATFVAACGIAPWKRRNVRQMLWNGRAPLRFCWRSKAAVALAAAEGGDVVVWAAKASRRLSVQAARMRVPVAYVEDGFIRSVGLGSDCVPPQSIAVDRQRPHYDPTGPSDLEAMLDTTSIPTEVIALSHQLIDRIVAAGLGKYGGRAGAGARMAMGHGQRIVLVAGQVEDDASVISGGAGVAGNLDLLRRARAVEPDAVLLYRPHPDVEAAHREGAIADHEALKFADQIDRATPLNLLFDQCDSVHVITSLAGFEALLRGKDVVTHGAPFYSGWGLTRDLGPPNRRRNRRLTVEALFACSIVHYPRYLDPRTLLPCPAEILVDRLIGNEVQSVSMLTRVRRLRRWPLIRQVFGR